MLIGAPTLTSTPGRFPVLAEPVADSVLDGGTVGGLTVRAASIRGDDHRFYGSPRQDAFALWTAADSASATPAMIASVADGVGSQPLSHLGAAAVGAHVQAELQQHLGALLDAGAEHELSDRLHSVFAAVADRLRVDARAHDVEPHLLSTTVVGAVFGWESAGSRRAVLFRVGDSLIFTLRGGTFEPAFVDGTQNVVLDTATSALPLQVGPVEIGVATLAPGDVVVLCTDGLGIPLGTEPVARQLADWWHAGPPDLAEFYWQLSFRAQTYGDDRTAVCVWVD
ncbi:protein phosphatase 2C domain-containing protein [Asanoa sp. NPDC049573]|uniref:protein phosphatase 2C domain-containing protein n=1 Tax=Asanoa sp. NPDC049573 TaxID=3155396 RepID=UPI0034148F3C